jgi:hypothetical protein
MINTYTFRDCFLAGLSRRKRAELEMRQSQWGIAPDDFYPRVETWFANFADKDKPLAFKILLNIDYYSDSHFKQRIADLWLPIKRFLFETGSSVDDILLVLPDEQADSADRHAYDVIKTCSLTQLQVVRVSKLEELADSGKILVFFNDTHGTGNQIVREMFRNISRHEFKAIFVLAATIARKALQRFKHEWDDVQVIPDCATPSAYERFTASELRRIRELGTNVYPSHPLGYGEAALLSAYYFQCPNNTLPLIWADGSNNAVGGAVYPWAPLFPYVPKKKTVSQVTAPAAVVRPEGALLDPASGAWQWSAEDRERLVERVARWNLETESFYLKVGQWFSNFSEEDKHAAHALFTHTEYFGIERIRDGIREMRKQVLVDIKKAGGDIGDVILVTTGDRKNSVYHYIFEFVREWRLEVNQVCEIEKLTPDKVIDKTLVFFYHTRPSVNGFATVDPESKRGTPSHWDRLSELSPRAIFVAAYAMPDTACKEFKELFGTRPNCRTIRIDEASGSLPEDYRRTLEVLENRLIQGGEKQRAVALSVAYYFQCPDSTSPLIWSQVTPAGHGKPWIPLFHHIRLPE